MKMACLSLSAEGQQRSYGRGTAKKEVHHLKKKQAIAYPVRRLVGAFVRSEAILNFAPTGSAIPTRRFKYVTDSGAPESQPRFGPPGSDPGTPTPGSAPGPALAGRGWCWLAGAVLTGRGGARCRGWRRGCRRRVPGWPGPVLYFPAGCGPRSVPCSVW